MGLRIIGEALDVRTQTKVVYAQADIKTYLRIIGERFDEFEIQRRRVTHKAYNRLREDIISGTLLPPITLALKNEFIERALSATNYNELEEILLVNNDTVNILDGLQRTHILHDIVRDEIELNPDQTIFLEIWLEKNINNLVYRIIVLNAGQKPMTMRHQIELLFSSVRTSLEHKVPGLEIFLERDNARRTKAKKYPFVLLSLSFYAYITKSPEIDKDNLVAQKLQEEEILAGGEDKFKNSFDRYAEILEVYTDIDQLLSHSKDGFDWIGSENVMLSFFASVGQFDSRKDGVSRVDNALRKLRADLCDAYKSGADVSEFICLKEYKDIIEGISPRKFNIGFATRKLLVSVFVEYFRSEGEISFHDLWLQEAN